MARTIDTDTARRGMRWPSTRDSAGWPPAVLLTFLALRDLCAGNQLHYSTHDVARLTGMSIATTSAHLKRINRAVPLAIRIDTGTRAAVYRLQS